MEQANQQEESMVAARKQVARLDAQITALVPLAAGDEEARSELLILRAKRTTAQESVTNLKTPAERVRILQVALGKKQIALAEAEDEVNKAQRAVVDAEVLVRDCRHAAEKQR